MPRELLVAGCRSECAWASTTESSDGVTVFACQGCGSEWTAAEEWTPVDWTGEVPASVQAERRLRGRG